MLNKKNTNGKKQKFNFYWIYAIIAVILISINLFSWNSGILKCTESEFESFLSQKQVNRVEVINHKEARVYIFSENLNEEPHSSKKIPNKNVFGGSNSGPHYTFIIPDNEKFRETLKYAEEKYKEDGKSLVYEYKEEDNFGKEILGWIIFFGIMIAVWAFIMRRVTGGAGGGGSPGHRPSRTMGAGGRPRVGRAFVSLRDSQRFRKHLRSLVERVR